MANEGSVDSNEILDQVEKICKTSLVFMGIIKHVDSESKKVLFSRTADCSSWIELPPDRLENIQFLQTVPCGDHTHPLVQIFVKMPQSEEAAFFAAIARLYHSVAIPNAAAKSTESNFQSVSWIPQAPSGDCYFDWKRGWVCPVS